MSDLTPPVETPEAGEQTVDTPKQPDFLSMMPEEIQVKVKELKAQVGSVFMTFLGDAAYLFRTLNVMEWMKVQKEQEQRAKAEGATEEFLQQSLFESIVMRASLGIIITDDNNKEKLLPPVSRDNVKQQGAGIPQSLAQQVMYHSGFDSNPTTVKL